MYFRLEYRGIIFYLGMEKSREYGPYGRDRSRACAEQLDGLLPFAERVPCAWPGMSECSIG